MAIADDERDGRIDYELTCPVPSCTYTHESAQGIVGHVGNGHTNGWDDAEATPRELHQAATVNDPEASRRVAKVEAYLAREGVPVEAVTVYEHSGFGSIQIDLDEWLGDDWDAFMGALDSVSARYIGDGRAYASREFVEELPTPPEDDVCHGNHCEQTVGLSPVFYDDMTVTMCQTCRTDYWEVSP